MKRKANKHTASVGPRLPKPALTLTDTGWGVLLTRHDGTPFLAYTDGARFFSYTRRAAADYRDRLAPHAQQRGKIVRLEVNYRVKSSK